MLEEKEQPSRLREPCVVLLQTLELRVTLEEGRLEFRKRPGLVLRFAGGALALAALYQGCARVAAHAGIAPMGKVASAGGVALAIVGLMGMVAGGLIQLTPPMAFDPKLRTFTFGKRAVPFDSVELRRLRAKGDGQFRRWMLTVRVSDRQVVLGTTSPLQKRELEAVAAHIAQMLPRPGGGAGARSAGP